MYVAESAATDDQVTEPSAAPGGARGSRREPAGNPKQTGSASAHRSVAKRSALRSGSDSTVSRRYSSCRRHLLSLGRPHGALGQSGGLRIYEAGSSIRRASIASAGTGPRISVALFAALPEEREILAKELNFAQDGAARESAGVLPDGTPAILYGGRYMGRVPAAVETSYLLSRHRDLSVILMAGLAGGFAENDVRQGHLLVPNVIYDLASRKISPVDGLSEARVRPQAWEIDQKLGEYLDSRIGEESLREACEKYGWPKDRRPMLRVGGAMACVDEVIADEDYRRRLQATCDGQLLGVEMESGGVIAAARRFHGLGFPVFQIRAVADTADPAKSDDQWRVLGMQTICSIVRRIRWHDLFATA
jgi:nucleoside phosphorylase